MRVAVIYVYPLANRDTYFPLAKRFTDTYRLHPAGYPHTLYVVHNGGGHLPVEMAQWAGIDHRGLVRSNLGWDIGAFQEYAETLACDLMVCLGAHIQFHHDGWLEKMVDSVINHGPDLYGPWGAMYPNPHIRTTAFWCPPQLIQSYPYTIGSTRQSRYEFEHGPRSFTRHVLSAGFRAFMVTLKGCFPYPYWQGNEPDPANSILLDKQHS